MKDEEVRLKRYRHTRWEAMGIAPNDLKDDYSLLST